MTRRVTLQPTAEREVAGIADWLATLSEGAALRFLSAFEEQVGLLEEDVVEHRLSRFDVLAALGYRSLFFEQYVMLYFIEGENVVIAHVFHQSQDYANLV